jgi:hypothetical protein
VKFFAFPPATPVERPNAAGVKPGRARRRADPTQEESRIITNKSIATFGTLLFFANFSFAQIELPAGTKNQLPARTDPIVRHGGGGAGG